MPPISDGKHSSAHGTVYSMHRMIELHLPNNLQIHRGPYMSAQVLMNLLNELKKRDEM